MAEHKQYSRNGTLLFEIDSLKEVIEKTTMLNGNKK